MFKRKKEYEREKKNVRKHTRLSREESIIVYDPLGSFNCIHKSAD